MQPIIVSPLQQAIDSVQLGVFGSILVSGLLWPTGDMSQMVAVHEMYSCGRSTRVPCCLGLLYFCAIAAFSSLQSLLVMMFEVKDRGWHVARREQGDLVVGQTCGVIFM